MNNTIVSQKSGQTCTPGGQKQVFRRSSPRTITMTALLAAISFILAYVQFMAPLSPSFARMDFSDFPALIGAFAFGPLTGVFIELIKNILRLTSTSTGGIGELANFLIGGSFVFSAGLIYQFRKTKRMAWISGLAGSVIMGIVAALSNYFILLPLFESFMPMDQMIAAFAAFIPFIDSKLDIVLYNALPANMLKGLIITVVTMIVYKRIRPVLKGIE